MFFYDEVVLFFVFLDDFDVRDDVLLFRVGVEIFDGFGEEVMVLGVVVVV